MIYSLKREVSHRSLLFSCLNRIGSELEIDERLDVTALHLHDQIYQQNQNQCLTDQRQTYHSPAASLLPTVWTGVQQISDSHKQKDLPVTRKQLSGQFRMKCCKIWRIMVADPSNVVFRKKIQQKHTKWKVSTTAKKRFHPVLR